MSRECREFMRRSWRHHPVLSALNVAVYLAFSVLVIINLVDGHSRWRSGLYLVLWVGSFVLLVVLIRRDEPPSE